MASSSFSSSPLSSLFSSPSPQAYLFASLGSGSSGNCYFLRFGEVSILIDAGLGARTIRNGLRVLGEDPASLSAIFITHDHADHVRGVGGLATKYSIPVVVEPRVAQALRSSRHISEDLTPFLRVQPSGEVVRIGGLEVLSFPVPHDSASNVGYSVRSSAGVFTVITDIGHITEDIRKAVRETNYLVFEANYDPEMLRSGTYPEFLKERITSGTGHLSNIESADFLASHYHLGLKYIALCHLSRDNNHPDLAWKTIEHRLACEGVRVGKDLELHALKRSTVSPLYRLTLGE